VFIAHYAAQLQFCIDPTDYCTLYAPYAIGDLSQVVAQLPDDPVKSVWFVLAAWQTEAKVWCGTEFGFAAYPGLAFTNLQYEPCFPATGGLEIPGTGWPGPGAGTAFVTTGDPWSGNYVPVYSFAGQAYWYYGPAQIQIDQNPHPPTSFCGFSNCSNPPQSYEVGPNDFTVEPPIINRGAMGIGMPGIVPVFGELPEPWACCIAQAPWCVEVTEAECTILGGVWHEGVLCVDANCPEYWACCVEAVCTIMTLDACNVAGGVWYPGLTCDPNPCPWVCCIQELVAPHTCIITTEADCGIQGGYWHPEFDGCDPNPCQGLTPVENSSWGQIKNMYR